MNLLRKPIDKFSRNDIKQLSAMYKTEFGKGICIGCTGDIINAYHKLKNLLMEQNFELKKTSHYRIQKGVAGTIHNGNITDELALQFLAINPERIKLFASYAENWQELIGDYMPDVQKEESLKIHIASVEIPEPCTECEEKRAELEALKLSDLRELYPEIKDTSKAGFIDKVIAQ